MNWEEMTFFDRISHLVHFGGQIYVRAHVDGRWQSVSLIELPDDQLTAELDRLARRRVPPVRMKEGV